MPAATKPDPAPTAAPEAAAAPEAVTLKPGRHKPPLSMAQQRFLLILMLMVSILGALAFVAIYKPDGAMQTAIFTILGVAFTGPLKDAFRHYFPGGQADQSPPPAK